MAKRRNQTSQDISELAANFRALWNEGQVLKSWLKIHGPAILERAKSGQWSWDNLGRAMTEAGITYQTGTPWTGENLRRNLLRAQIPGKRELKLLRGSSEPAQQTTSQMANATPANDASITVLRPTLGKPRELAGPEFQLIRRAVDTGRAAVEVASLPPRPARRTLSPEELHDIALGRSAKR